MPETGKGPTGSFDRRDALRLLGTTAGATIAAQVTGLPAAIAAGATPPANLAGPGTNLSRGRRLQLERGLFLGCWVNTSETVHDGAPGHVPTPAEWEASGFTTPVYYWAPQYEPALQDGLAEDAPWGAANMPGSRNGSKVDRPPEPGERLLRTPAARANAANAYEVQIGDEEPYTEQLVTWLAEWFELGRREAPAGLVHNNQFAGQWSPAQLTDLMRRARPDILTFDEYVFSHGTARPHGSVPTVYDDLAPYREVALAGHDGSGAIPVPFGQYTLGFRSGEQPSLGGSYVVSESQLRIVTYATWTMGGTWTCMFRWMDEAGGYSSLLYHQGELSPQFHQYAAVHAEGRHLGPYLTRLLSSDVRAVPGVHRDETGAIVPNTPPERIVQLDDTAPPYLTEVEARNTGGAVDQLPGDILVGYFRRLPGMSDEDAEAGIRDTDADRFFGPGTKHLMVLNGLAVPNEDYADPHATGGTAAQTEQEVTLTFHRFHGARNRLWKANRQTGRLTEIPLIDADEHRQRASVRIPGGTADLLVFRTGRTFDALPTVTVGADRDVVETNQEIVVTATVANQSDDILPDLALTLEVPDDLEARSPATIRFGTLRPGARREATWSLGVLPEPTSGRHVLTVTSSHRYAPGSDVRAKSRTTTHVQVPYDTFEAAFDNRGTSNDNDTDAADIDGSGSSLSTQALAEVGVRPGMDVRHDGTRFTWPDAPAGKPNNIVASGQAIRLTGKTDRLRLLLTSTWGPCTGTGRIRYADGREENYELRAPDWYGKPEPGSATAIVAPYRNRPGNSQDRTPVAVYGAEIPLHPDRDISYIVLPNISDGANPNVPAMHLFAVTTAGSTGR